MSSFSFETSARAFREALKRDVGRCVLQVMPDEKCALMNVAGKSRVHCRRRCREPSFAAAEVSPCGQGKVVGLVS